MKYVVWNLTTGTQELVEEDGTRLAAAALEDPRLRDEPQYIAVNGSTDRWRFYRMDEGEATALGWVYL